MDIKLQPEEAKLFARILDEYLSDLRMEIGRTEQYDLRESMKQDESMIKAMLARLNQGQMQAGS
ncbi:MAG: hypothetical protein HYX94_02320 [Chloroflexi bacterium]|nr:hypothetical protein [Chloroflexota bacterium]